MPANPILDSSVPFSYFPPGMQNTQGINTGIQFLHSQQTGQLTQPVNTNLYQQPQPTTPTSPFAYPQQRSPQPHTPILAQQVLKPNIGTSLFNFEDNTSKTTNGRQTIKAVQHQPQPVAVIPLHYLPEVLEIEKALASHAELIEKMRYYSAPLSNRHLSFVQDISKGTNAKTVSRSVQSIVHWAKQNETSEYDLRPRTVREQRCELILLTLFNL